MRPLEVVAGGSLAFCDDDTAKKIRDGGRMMTALYVGGMGAKGKNFYNNIFRKYGYENEAEQIQDFYLSGQKDSAEAAVPDEFLKATAMVGDEGWGARSHHGLQGIWCDPPIDQPSWPRPSRDNRKGQGLDQLSGETPPLGLAWAVCGELFGGRSKKPEVQRARPLLAVIASSTTEALAGYVDVAALVGDRVFIHDLFEK